MRYIYVLFLSHILAYTYVPVCILHTLSYILTIFSLDIFNEYIAPRDVSCYKNVFIIFFWKNFFPYKRKNFCLSLPLFLPSHSFHRRPRDGVSLAPTARAVDRSSWQPSDESTVAQGGWTAGWRAWTDRGEVSARADAEPDVYVRTFDTRSLLSFSLSLLLLLSFFLSLTQFSPSFSPDRAAIHPAYVFMVFVVLHPARLQTTGREAVVSRWQWHYGVIRSTS